VIADHHLATDDGEEQAMSTKDVKPDIAPRLAYGMAAIADFFAMPERKAYGLAVKGQLPGAFKIGPRQWALDQEVAREGIRSRASGEQR
jgi:hypothetical protein